MNFKPKIIAMDLEGVLIPEIWIAVSEKTRIDNLKLTTRDIPDYDELMRGRLDILKQHNLTIKDIQKVISTLDPMPGARKFVDSIREKTQLIIVSDTFYEFAHPLMVKLGLPVLFCNSLKIDSNNMIADYNLRQKNGKKKAVKAFMKCGFSVMAVGDSYNDTAMLAEADAGILFRPPENIIDQFPQYPVTQEYAKLKQYIEKFLDT
ncbi:bifunctional phosphoserine phosphatase/homoserine phosphotransferase ThrH [bacterium]|nr:bifunctional phosphoserine phosphatase/homoserine phosphotransferase ThrH [bacterium]